MKERLIVKLEFITLILLLLMLPTACDKESLDKPKGSPQIPPQGANLPSINTKEITHITSTSASTGGVIISDGGAEILSKGIVWSINPSPTLLTSSVTLDGFGSSDFASMLTKLDPYNTYYLRAYATNSAGTSYGNEIAFKTKTNITTYSNIYDINTLYLGTDLVTTSDGGFVTSRTHIVKLDSLGTVLWMKEIKNDGNMTDSQIIKSQDQGFLVGNSISLQKFDEHGNVKWTNIRVDQYNQLVGVAIHSFVESNDGKCYVIGVAPGVGQALQMLDQQGKLIWTKYLAYMQDTYWITKTDDGNFLVAGTSGFGELQIAKIDSDGNLIWSKVYSHSVDVSKGKIINCNNGSFMLAIQTVGPYNSWSNWVLKIDETGNKIWERVLELGSGSYLNNATPLADGGYLLVGGYYYSPYNPLLAFILKLDEDGNNVWLHSFQSQDYLDFTWSFRTVKETIDKGLIILGYQGYVYSEPKRGSWLLKTDKNGNFNQ